MSPLGIRIAGIALAMSALVVATCTLGKSEDAVTRFLESGRTDVALVTAVENGYLSDCRAATRAAAVTVDQDYTAFGMESHCRCSLDWFLQHADEGDLRTLLEAGEIAAAAEATQASARDHCRDELTSG